MNFLVAGGSGVYGTALVSELRQKQHTVYEAQREATTDGDIDVILEYWRQCDFDNGADLALLVQSFVAEDIQIDGVAFLQKHLRRIDLAELGPYDLQRHVMVNVISPLFAIRYMSKYGVLVEGARVIFPLDKRAGLDTSYVSYRASKAILPTLVEICLDDIVSVLKHFYLTLPETPTPEVVCRMIEILEGENSLVGRMHDLRQMT